MAAFTICAIASRASRAFEKAAYQRARRAMRNLRKGRDFAGAPRFNGLRDIEDLITGLAQAIFD